VRTRGPATSAGRPRNFRSRMRTKERGRRTEGSFVWSKGGNVFSFLEHTDDAPICSSFRHDSACGRRTPRLYMTYARFVGNPALRWGILLFFFFTSLPRGALGLSIDKNNLARVIILAEEISVPGIAVVRNAVACCAPILPQNQNSRRPSDRAGIDWKRIISCARRAPLFVRTAKRRPMIFKERSSQHATLSSGSTPTGCRRFEPEGDFAFLV